jgi:predicted glutamine amidotransferase
MCRLLAVRDETSFDVVAVLKPFAKLSKKSKEFQGHGWGFSYIDEEGTWQHYKNIKPIWEDNLEGFGRSTFLIAHARSAFEDKDIVVENNMPFMDDKFIFIFNGELRGVKIKEEGRIGAEKIFNFIKRFNERKPAEMLEKGTRLIQKRSKYVRALNIIMTDRKKVFVTNIFNEEPEYFQMYYKVLGKRIMVCSDPFPTETDWEKVETNKVVTF